MKFIVHRRIKYVTQVLSADGKWVSDPCQAKEFDEKEAKEIAKKKKAKILKAEVMPSKSSYPKNVPWFVISSFKDYLNVARNIPRPIYITMEDSKLNLKIIKSELGFE